MNAKFLLLALISLTVTGCVDARSTANSTVGYISRTADRSPPLDSGPTNAPDASPAVVGFVGPQVTIIEAESGGRVSAFGLRWMVVPSVRRMPVSVRDLPGVDATVLGELADWEFDFWVAERVRETGDGKWRRVTMNDGTAGWVQAKRLMAQPERISGADQRKIRTLVNAGVGESTLVYVDEEPPRLLHHVQVVTDTADSALLFDWSGRDVALIGVFASPGDY